MTFAQLPEVVSLPVVVEVCRQLISLSLLETIGLIVVVALVFKLSKQMLKGFNKEKGIEETTDDSERSDGWDYD